MSSTNQNDDIGSLPKDVKVVDVTQEVFRLQKYVKTLEEENKRLREFILNTGSVLHLNLDRTND